MATTVSIWIGHATALAERLHPPLRAHRGIGVRAATQPPLNRVSQVPLRAAGTMSGAVGGLLFEHEPGSAVSPRVAAPGPVIFWSRVPVSRRRRGSLVGARWRFRGWRARRPDRGR